MKIKGIGSAFARDTVSNTEIAAWSGLDPGFITEKLGISSRQFLAADEMGIDLAEAATKDLGRQYPDFDPAKLDAIVYVTQNPDYGLPHSAALLQPRIGAPTTAAAFDVGLGCSGYVYGLALTRSLQVCEKLENALLITCDPYSRILSRADRNTIALFGDAATATWLSSEGGARIGLTDFGTDGSGAKHLIHPSAGIAGRSKTVEGEFLYMNGRQIFNFMMTRVPDSVSRCLARNGLEQSGIEKFFFHQASRYLLESLRERLELVPSRVPIALQTSGNTVSSTIPILMKEAIDFSDPRARRYLLSGFGVGLSWATTIVSIGDQS